MNANIHHIPTNEPQTSGITPSIESQNGDLVPSDLVAAGAMIDLRKGNYRMTAPIAPDVDLAADANSAVGSTLTESGELLIDVDRQLVERVQKGDKRAFDLLVIKYQHRIFAIISRFIRDHSEVQDVAQDAFLKAYRALPNFRGESAFYTWMYRIAINTAKNYLVARNRRPPSSDLDVEEAEFFSDNDAIHDMNTPEHNLLSEELHGVINQAFNELPDDLRTAVTLREIEGLSYEEIAEVMQCPIGTVRSRIFRARESIDRRIQPLID